jgi:hypothetical protein
VAAVHDRAGPADDRGDVGDHRVLDLPVHVLVVEVSDQRGQPDHPLGFPAQINGADRHVGEVDAEIQIAVRAVCGLLDRLGDLEDLGPPLA